MNARLVKFRVHFTDETTIDVEAVSATAARDKARDQKGGGKPAGIVSKVKVIREVAA